MQLLEVKYIFDLFYMLSPGTLSVDFEENWNWQKSKAISCGIYRTLG